MNLRPAGAGAERRNLAAAAYRGPPAQGLGAPWNRGPVPGRGGGFWSGFILTHTQRDQVQVRLVTRKQRVAYDSQVTRLLGKRQASVSLTTRRQAPPCGLQGNMLDVFRLHDSAMPDALYLHDCAIPSAPGTPYVTLPWTCPWCRQRQQTDCLRCGHVPKTQGQHSLRKHTSGSACQGGSWGGQICPTVASAQRGWSGTHDKGESQTHASGMQQTSPDLASAAEPLVCAGARAPGPPPCPRCPVFSVALLQASGHCSRHPRHRSCPWPLQGHKPGICVQHPDPHSLHCCCNPVRHPAYHTPPPTPILRPLQGAKPGVSLLRWSPFPAPLLLTPLTPSHPFPQPS